VKDTVIFDLDGVIVDSEPIRYETYKQLFRKNYLIELPEKMDSVLVGRTQMKNITYFLNKYNLKGNVEELIRQRAVLLKKAFSKKENIKPLAGLFTLLKNLQLYNFKLAIASSSSREYMNIILNQLHLNDVFNIIVSGDDVSNSKPDPEIFIQAANKLNKKRENCVIIEDSLHGITAEKVANIKVIAITSCFSREQLNSADLIVDDLSQISLQEIQSI
jgi:HAD superfamily hydrolase (TIGR01509 family)